MSTLTDHARRLSTLKALADTWVPRLREPSDPHGFFALRASDLGVPEELMTFITTRFPEPARKDVFKLLDTLWRMGLPALPVPVRERVVLWGLARLSTDVA